MNHRHYRAGKDPVDREIFWIWLKDPATRTADEVSKLGNKKFYLRDQFTSTIVGSLNLERA